MRTLSLHSHTLYSERDAIIDPMKAAAKIKAHGGTHYSVTDHGTATGWLALRDACDKNKLVPVYGVELYVNDLWDLFLIVQRAREDASSKDKAIATIQAVKQFAGNFMSPARMTYFLSGLEEFAGKPAEIAKRLFQRLAFGYSHLVCVATTAAGREALIRLHNKGWMEGYYYKPQVRTIDCIEADIDSGGGLLWTSACMGGPIANALRVDPTGAEACDYLERWRSFAKERWFLEVQPLDLIEQRIYNQQLIDLSSRTGFPLILSQDNHHLDKDEWVAHRLLMLGQNDQTSDKIEDIYNYKGQQLAFSDLKKHLGKATTWEVQQIIIEENIPLMQKAGHHYGDVCLHWRTNEEVAQQCETTNPELLPVLEQCFRRTDAICDMIEPIKWGHDFHIPKHEGSRELVLRICIHKMRSLGLGNDKTYTDWLKREDRVITACGFYDYLWTLYLVCSEAQKRGIPIGYARGSGGGCLIMYLLGVIRVDPVKYGLFFDRFLNPARLGLNPVTLEKEKDMASCPDVDLDFSSIHRQEVIQLAKELFGADRVIPVGTINLSKLKSAFADLCRVCGIKQADYIPASKELPDDPAQKMTFEEAMVIPAFSKFVKQHPIIQHYLSPLVGVAKARGQHAGGVCIADAPIAQHIPVVRAGSKEEGGIVTGFGESGAVRALESVGYIKFDFLATDTVDHVSLCARLLHEDHLARGGTSWGTVLYPEDIPHYTLDDPAVMQAIFHAGNTDGIFQMEESIGKDLCALIKPDTVGEVADISTMIRPGCLQAPATYTIPNSGGMFEKNEGVGLHFEYAARKFHGAHNPPPDLPAEILDVIRPTHYCCIYQEQMMGLIVVCSGGKLSLGEGDIYRRNIELMGKGRPGAAEKVAEIEAQIKAAGAYPPELIDRVTTIIKGGANYAFNKSHSLSYSLFSYAQAWFKHYYPHIFLAAHITLLADKGKVSKSHKITNNMKQWGLSVASPSLIYSSDRATWSDDGKTVFLPFQVMKGFKGDTSRALQSIASQCRTVNDFLKQALAHPDIKKNHAINMAKVGALDHLPDNPHPRQMTVAIISYVWNCATTKTRPEVIDKHVEDFVNSAQVLMEIPKQRLMDWELEVFGGFINECPLTDTMIERLERMGHQPISQVEPEPDQEFDVYFMITSIIKKVHKPGSKYAGKEWYKLICWDGQGVGELSVWAKDLIGDPERKIIGYKSKILPNRCYTARISCDGVRPTTLVYRGQETSRDTLYLQE